MQEAQPRIDTAKLIDLSRLMLPPSENSFAGSHTSSKGRALIKEENKSDVSGHVPHLIAGDNEFVSELENII